MVNAINHDKTRKRPLLLSTRLPTAKKKGNKPSSKLGGTHSDEKNASAYACKDIEVTHHPLVKKKQANDTLVHAARAQHKKRG